MPVMQLLPHVKLPAPLADLTPTQTLAVAVAGLGTLLWIKGRFFRPKNAPPKVPSAVPFFGNIVAFGERPIDFLHGCYKKVWWWAGGGVAWRVWAAMAAAALTPRNRGGSTAPCSASPCLARR